MMIKGSQEVHLVDLEVSELAEEVDLETALTASNQATCPRIVLNQRGREHSEEDSEEDEEVPEMAET
jgi:hypothetical protein